MDYKTHKGASYFKSYQDARAVKNSLLEDNPQARIVTYERGYAIQQRISGPYWDHDEKVFK